MRILESGTKGTLAGKVVIFSRVLEEGASFTRHRVPLIFAASDGNDLAKRLRKERIPIGDIRENASGFYEVHHSIIADHLYNPTADGWDIIELEWYGHESNCLPDMRHREQEYFRKFDEQQDSLVKEFNAMFNLT